MTTTNNAVNTTLSGQTGTGGFVGSTSPTLITPNLGVPSVIDISNATGTVGALTSIAFSPTTGGIVGTNTNDMASAGIVGELISNLVLFASSTSLSNNTAKNVTSISLTAGDWDVWGNTSMNITSGALNGGNCWVSLTSATQPDRALTAGISDQQAELNTISFTVPMLTFQLASTTTVYLSVLGNFTGGATACGGIYARRRR